LKKEKIMPKKIVIIGGGPGGYVAAIRAAQLGAEVHLVEKKALGGTCLNVGCIPTKAILHVAEMYQALLKGNAIGIMADNIRLDWPVVLRYQKSLVNRLVNGVTSLLKANKVTVHTGHACLKSAGLVEVGGRSIEPDTILLAVGSEPLKLPVPGAELDGVIDSTSALNLHALPKSLVVVGGGVIGVEFASMYRSFGTEVTIVEMLPHILPGVDGEIVRQVHEDLIKANIDAE
jgi:dihydrolipoamide dehydrogenase